MARAQSQSGIHSGWCNLRVFFVPLISRPPRLRVAVGLPALLTLLGVVVAPTIAAAQTGLLTEAARDPGRTDVPQTARQLGLGSVLAGSGDADSAASVPGLLTLRAGTDLVFALGSSSYSRPELVLTPRDGPNDGRRQNTPARFSWIGHAAVAARGAKWAVAGFLDRSGYSHGFTTDKTLVTAGYLYPWCFEINASGEAQVQQGVTRSGGSLAVGDGRAGVGVSVYGIHLDYLLQTDELLENVNCSANQPRRVSYENAHSELRFDNWAAGFSISGHVGIGKAGLVIARWRREPEFTGKTTGGARVDFNLPDTLSAGWMTRRNATIFVADVSWQEYGAADFVTYLSVPEKLFCYGLGDRVRCGMRNTFSVRSGLEHGVPAGKGRMLLRGGVAWEPGYTFAREAYPWGFGPVPGLSGPMTWDPPREDSIWISGGAAYSRNHREVGVGVGHANQQWRLIVDLRLVR